jgi:hypothetical protein
MTLSGSALAGHAMYPAFPEITFLSPQNLVPTRAGGPSHRSELCPERVEKITVRRAMQLFVPTARLLLLPP